jgi:Tfp pilus assembly protein PilW
MKLTKFQFFRRRAGSKGHTGGWVLAESVLAVGIGISFLVALTGIFVSSNINFVGVGNYISMDRNSRNALDRMTRSIRNANILTSYDPALLVFNYDSAGTTNLTYRYDSSSGNLTEEWTVAGNTTVTTLLTACSSCSFSLFDRDLAASTDLSSGQGKVVSIAWKCSNTVLGRTNSEYMQQAKIVIRNQP